MRMVARKLRQRAFFINLCGPVSVKRKELDKIETGPV